MRFILVFLLSDIIGLQVYGQKDSSVVKEKPNVEITIGKVVASIKNAYGFKLTSQNKWVSAKMRIPYENNDKNSTMYDAYDIGEDNINRFDIRPIKIQDSSYYLWLIGVNKIKRKEADYGSFEMDKLYRYEEVEFFVFTKDELLKLRNNNKPFNALTTINLNFTYAGMFGMNKKLNLEQRINDYVADRVLDSTVDIDSTQSYLQFVFVPTVIKGLKYYKFNRYYAYSRKDEEPVSFGIDDFTNQYFRVSESEFKSFTSFIK